jgi:Fur family peroxide stress response transcriptional regulator
VTRFHTESARVEEFAALCRRRGVPVTVQRRAILEELAGRDDHPTADDVFTAVQDRIPGVSRTTVYRVLDTLVDVGAARRVAHPGAAVRYDAKVRRHHHLICSRCGTVRDLDDAALDALVPRARVRGFEVHDYSVHFTGVCAQCRASGAKRGSKEKDK